MMSPTCKTIYMTVLLVVFVSCALEQEVFELKKMVDKLEKGFPSRKYSLGKGILGEET